MCLRLAYRMSCLKSENTCSVRERFIHKDFAVRATITAKSYNFLLNTTIFRGIVQHLLSERAVASELANVIFSNQSCALHLALYQLMLLQHQVLFQ